MPHQQINALVSKLHPNDQQREALGSGADLLINSDPHYYETHIAGLTEPERLYFYQYLVLESVSAGGPGPAPVPAPTPATAVGVSGISDDEKDRDKDRVRDRENDSCTIVASVNTSMGCSVLNKLCYHAMYMLIRGISIDMSAIVHLLEEGRVEEIERDTTNLVTMLSAFAYIVSTLWISEEGHQLSNFNEESKQTEEIKKTVCIPCGIEWTVVLLTDCVLDHDDILVNLIGLLDEVKHETIPLLVYYIFAKQNIATWIEPFHDLFLQKALLSLSFYNIPQVAATATTGDNFPSKLIRSYTSKTVEMLYETYILLSIAKLFQLNNISEEVLQSLGMKEFLKDLLEKFINGTQGTIGESEDDVLRISSHRDAMIKVIFAVPKSYMWVSLSFVLVNIPQIMKCLSDVISMKPSSVQIYEVSAAWNTLLYVLSLLGGTINEIDTKTSKCLKSSQQSLSEFERKKKTMLLKVTSTADILQTILQYEPTIAGDNGAQDYEGINKVKFFELITPKQGVGMLALPLQNLLRHSRLAASLCYSNLIHVLRSFEMWHVPSGGLKLVLRCLHHLLLNIPNGLIDSDSNSPILTSQRSEYLKSFSISSNALFQLLENIESEVWKDLRVISVPIGQQAKQTAAATSNNVSNNGNLITLTLLQERLAESLHGFSDSLNRWILSRNNFGVILLFQKLYAASRAWRSIGTLDAVQRGLLIPRQVAKAFSSGSFSWNYCHVMSTGNSVFDVDNGNLNDLFDKLFHVTEQSYGSKTATKSKVASSRFAVDNGLFSFKNIFAKTAGHSTFGSSFSHFASSSDLASLRAAAKLIALCCDFVFQASKKGTVDFDNEIIVIQMTTMFNSLRIVWQYYIYGLAHSLFAHLSSTEEDIHDKEKLNTQMSAYMTTQMEHSHSLRSLFPSPLKNFAYPQCSQQFASQDRDPHGSQDHGLEQLIICSSFPPAVEVTQELLGILHNVMVHLLLTIFCLSKNNRLLHEVLHTQALVLESMWWFLHRITGFGIDIRDQTNCELTQTSILKSFNPKNTKRSIFEELRLLSEHLGVYLPIPLTTTDRNEQDGSGSFEEQQHGASYVMLLSVMHFHYHHCYDSRKSCGILFTALSCCINGLTESAVLPSLCSFIPPIVVYRMEPLHSSNALLKIDHFNDDHCLTFISFFLKLVYGRLSQMTSPSPSEQMEQELMVSMTEGLRIMLSVPLLILSVMEYRLDYSHTNLIINPEDVFYSCLRQCWNNIDVMISLWIDLERICEAFRGTSDCLPAYCQLDGVSNCPLKFVWTTSSTSSMDNNNNAEMLGAQSNGGLLSFSNRANLVANFTRKISKGLAALPHQGSNNSNHSLHHCTGSISKVWTEQLFNQCLGLLLRIILKFYSLVVSGSILGKANDEILAHVAADKVYINDLVAGLKSLLAFEVETLNFLCDLSKHCIKTKLCTPTNTVLTTIPSTHILQSILWIYLLQNQNRTSKFTLGLDSLKVKDWFKNVCDRRAASNGFGSLCDLVVLEFPFSLAWKESLAVCKTLMVIDSTVETIDDAESEHNHLSKKRNREDSVNIVDVGSVPTCHPSTPKLKSVKSDMLSEEPHPLGGSATQTPAKTPGDKIAQAVQLDISKPSFDQVQEVSIRPDKRVRQGFAPITYTSVDRENLMESTQQASQDVSQPLLLLQALAPPKSRTHAVGDISLSDEQVKSIARANNEQAKELALSAPNVIDVELQQNVDVLQDLINHFKDSHDNMWLWKALQQSQSLSNGIIERLNNSKQ